MTDSFLFIIFIALFQGSHGQITNTIYPRHSVLLEPCQLTPDYRPSTFTSDGRSSTIYAYGEIRTSCLRTNSIDEDIDIAQCLEHFFPRIWHSIDSGATWECYPTDPSLNRISNSLLIYRTQELDYQSAPNILVNTGPGDDTTCNMLCSFGGWTMDNSTVRASNEAYCSFDGGHTWETQAPLPHPLVHATAYQHLNNIYLVGGESDGVGLNSGFLQALFLPGTCNIKSWRQPTSFIRGRDYGNRITPFRNHRYPVITSRPDGSGLLIGGGHIDLDHYTVPAKPPDNHGTGFHFSKQLWSTTAYPLDLSLWTFVSNTLPISYTEVSETLPGAEVMFPKSTLSFLVDSSKFITKSMSSFSFFPQPVSPISFSYTHWASQYLYNIESSRASLVLISPCGIMVSEDLGESWTETTNIDYPYPYEDHKSSLLPYIFIATTTGTDDMAQVLILSQDTYPLPNLRLNALYPKTDCYVGCGAGQYTLGCTISPTDAQCFACRSCGPNSFISTPCGGDYLGYGDTRCKRCSSCNAPEITLSPCNQTHDTVCSGNIDEMITQTWRVFLDDSGDFFRGYDTDIRLSSIMLLSTFSICLYALLLLFALFIASSQFNSTMFGQKWVTHLKRYRSFLAWIRHPLNSELLFTYFLHPMVPGTGTSPIGKDSVQDHMDKASQDLETTQTSTVHHRPLSRTHSSPTTGRQDLPFHVFNVNTNDEPSVENDAESSRSKFTILCRAPFKYILGNSTFFTRHLCLFTIRGICMAILTAAQAFSAFGILLVTAKMTVPYSRITTFFYGATLSILIFYFATLLMTCLGMRRYNAERRRYVVASESHTNTKTGDIPLPFISFPMSRPRKHMSSFKESEHPKELRISDRSNRWYVDPPERSPSGSSDADDIKCKTSEPMVSATPIPAPAVKEVSCNEDTEYPSTDKGTSMTTPTVTDKVTQENSGKHIDSTKVQSLYSGDPSMRNKPKSGWQRSLQMIIFNFVYLHVRVLSFMHPRMFYVWADLFYTCFPYTVLQNTPIFLTHEDYNTARKEDIPESNASEAGSTTLQTNPIVASSITSRKHKPGQVSLFSRPLIHPGGIINWRSHKQFQSPFIPDNGEDRQMLDRYFPKMYMSYRLICLVSLVGDALFSFLSLALLVAVPYLTSEKDLREFENIHIWEDFLYLITNTPGSDFDPPESTSSKPFRFVSRSTWDAVSSTTLQLARSKIGVFARVYMMIAVFTFVLDLAACFRVFRVDPIHTLSNVSSIRNIQTNEAESDKLSKDSKASESQRTVNSTISHLSELKMHLSLSGDSDDTCEVDTVYVHQTTCDDTISRCSSLNVTDASGSGLSSLTRGRSGSNSLTSAYISAEYDSPDVYQSDPRSITITSQAHRDSTVQSYIHDWGGDRRCLENPANGPHSEAFDLLDESISDESLVLQGLPCTVDNVSGETNITGDGRDTAESRPMLFNRPTLTLPSYTAQSCTHTNAYERNPLSLSPSERYASLGYADNDDSSSGLLTPSSGSLQDGWKAHPFYTFLRQLESLPSRQISTTTDSDIPDTTSGESRIADDLTVATQGMDEEEEEEVCGNDEGVRALAETTNDEGEVTDEVVIADATNTATQSLSEDAATIVPADGESETEVTNTRDSNAPSDSDNMRWLLDNPPALPPPELIPFAQRELASLLLRRLDLARVPELLSLIDALQSQRSARHNHSRAPSFSMSYVYPINPHLDGYFTDHSTDDGIASEGGRPTLQRIPTTGASLRHSGPSSPFGTDGFRRPPPRVHPIPGDETPLHELVGFRHGPISVAPSPMNDSDRESFRWDIGRRGTMTSEGYATSNCEYTGIAESPMHYSDDSNDDIISDYSAMSSHAAYSSASRTEDRPFFREYSSETSNTSQGHLPNGANRRTSNFTYPSQVSPTRTPTYYSNTSPHVVPPTPPLRVHIPPTSRSRGVSYSTASGDPIHFSHSGSVTPNTYHYSTRQCSTCADDCSDQQVESTNDESEMNTTADSPRHTRTSSSVPRYMSTHALYTTPYLSSRETTHVADPYSNTTNQLFPRMSSSYSAARYNSPYSSDRHHLTHLARPSPAYPHPDGGFRRRGNRWRRLRQYWDYLTHSVYPHDRRSLSHGLPMQMPGYVSQNVPYSPTMDHLTRTSDGLRESGNGEYSTSDTNWNNPRPDPRGHDIQWRQSSGISTDRMHPDTENAQIDEDRHIDASQLNPQEVLDSSPSQHNPLDNARSFGHDGTISMTIRSSTRDNNESDIESDPAEGGESSTCGD